MTPYYEDPWLTVYQGDCKAVMAELPAESVHCVVTSPPYWGLRDYGTAAWEGGDEGCDHAFKPDAGKTTIRTTQTYQQGHPHRDCKCGARRQDSQLGLEATPEEYVANMVAVFREVKRVLRNDGTVWLNLGDSYSVSLVNKGGSNRGKSGTSRGTLYDKNRDRPTPPPGLKPKDLVGIPWRVAFALQADGWYLRSDIIWAKPNPMPESVTDRPTKAHEYLFLLSKSPRYYYDADAVREPHAELDRPQSEKRRLQRLGREVAPVNGGGQSSKGIDDGWVTPTHTMRTNEAGRNLRSVWNIATQPYPGAHFATFPRKLVEPCVKAGCPELGTVLDPFAGSGTTGVVAQSLNRRAILIDLNGDYLVQAMQRNRDIPLGLGAA